MSEVVIGLGFIMSGVGILGLLWELQSLRRSVISCLVAEHRIMERYDKLWDEQVRKNWDVDWILTRHSERLGEKPSPMMGLH